jgi:hypothetical protein
MSLFFSYDQAQHQISVGSMISDSIQALNDGSAGAPSAESHLALNGIFINIKRFQPMLKGGDTLADGG